jgi:predicted MFS family arabinose efflux permease
MTMTIATQLRGVVVAWQVYAITHDPLSLGLIGLAEALPFIAVALFAGHVADRMDRRRIVVGSLVLTFACALALLLLTLHGARHPFQSAWPFYAVIFVSGISRSFLMPARTALAAELVPRELYANASAWRTSSFQFAAVTGPALGGVLYAAVGPAGAYTVDVCLMLTALAAMRLVLAPVTTRMPLQRSVLRGLAEGVAFLRSQPVLLGAMSLDLFSVLFGGAVALLPIFASDVLHVGPQGLGALRAAPAAGAVVMSLWLAHRPPMQRAGRSLLLSVAVFGAAMLGFALSRNFALSLGFLALSGMVDTVSVVVRSTLLQVFTPDALLGRVSAVNAVFIGSSNEIGAFESGLLARLLGTIPSVLIGGTMTLVTVGLTAWKAPALRRLGEMRAE